MVTSPLRIRRRRSVVIRRYFRGSLINMMRRFQAQGSGAQLRPGRHDDFR